MCYVGVRYACTAASYPRTVCPMVKRCLRKAQVNAYKIMITIIIIIIITIILKQILIIIIVTTITITTY